MRNILLASTLLPFLLVTDAAGAGTLNSQASLGEQPQTQESISYPAPVGLNPSVRVQGRIVRLGHLFSGLDEQANTPIARSPELGKSVELTAQWLGAVARAYKIEWTPRSTFDVSRVERASISITATDISPVLLDELDEDGDGDTSNVQLQFDEPNATFLLPEEAGRAFKLVAFRKDSRTGRFAATLELGNQGPNMRRVQLNGQSYEMTKIPVFRHRLEDNAVVEADDLDWMTVRADRIPQGSALDQEDIIGKAVSRRLRAGKAIRLSDLGEPVTIHKKSAVTIVVDHGLMQLTAQGRAMEDGQVGDLIRVMNIQSNKTVHAIVVGENLVEINLAAKQLSQLTKSVIQ